MIRFEGRVNNGPCVLDIRVCNIDDEPSDMGLNIYEAEVKGEGDEDWVRFQFLHPRRKRAPALLKKVLYEYERQRRSP